MNSLPFGQLKSFLKILIEVQYDTEKSYRRGNCPGGIFCVLAAGSRLQYAMYVLQVENRGVGGVALHHRASSNGIKVLVTVEFYVKISIWLCVIDILYKFPVAVVPDIDFPLSIHLCTMQAACLQIEPEGIAVFYFKG